MLHEALGCFIKLDADQARKVTEKDDEVDALYQQILRELLTYMMQDARTISGRQPICCGWPTTWSASATA